MTYKTIVLTYSDLICTITFNRVESKNSINYTFLQELNQALDELETSSPHRTIILQGQQGYFCTGMDFNEIAFDSEESLLSTLYMETIKRLSLIPRIIIAKVDGQVMAGGVGITAAADLVVATPRSTFNLSEALWGLLPACVTPYLIRRIGFQNAYKMTLTTLTIHAQKACEMNLIDELTDEPDKVIHQLALRFSKLKNTTIAAAKHYFRKMWIITEQMEQTAVNEISYLAKSPEVQTAIQRFVQLQQFPWE